MINVKRLSIAICLIFVIAIIGLIIWSKDQYVVPILMYHSISKVETKPVSVFAKPSNILIHLNIVSPEIFDNQMGYLKDHGYHVISLDDYIAGKKVGKKFSHKSVVITFDDGYMDNYTNAFPILKKYHFPATIFLISDYVGKSKYLMNWDQVKVMSQNGISFGSHTRRHAYLPNLTKEQAKDEIIESKHDIEAHLGKPVDYIAYPCAGFSEEIKVVVALAGYKAALTTNRGHDHKNIDLFELDRIHIKNSDNKLIFKGKLSGFYNFFRELKSSH